MIEKIIFTKLEDYIDSKTKIFIGVSGGADSMFLFFMLNEFFKYKGFKKNNIKILHFDHGVRKESKKEKIKLKSFFKEVNFITRKNKIKKKDEFNLRKKRYEFFETFYKKIKSENKYLLLGHNLDDRIETTFLNLIRGCNIKGFINMNFFSINEKGIKILRPLINIGKKEILEYCHQYGIDYYDDYTNYDINFSKRNLIRKLLVENFYGEKSNFKKSFNYVFNYLEKKIGDDIDSVILKEYKFSKYIVGEKGNIGFFVVSKIDNFEKLTILFEKLKIYNGVTTSLLTEFLKFFVNSSSGIKYFNGKTFFQSHGNVYILDGQIKNYIYLGDVLEIKKKGFIDFGDFNVNIDKDDFIGGKIRFPQLKDKFGGKSIFKYMLNNKIPIFWRNYIPLIEKEKKIIKIFYELIKIRG